jgi:hypothetical protein
MCVSEFSIYKRGISERIICENVTKRGFVTVDIEFSSRESHVRGPGFPSSAILYLYEPESCVSRQPYCSATSLALPCSVCGVSINPVERARLPRLVCHNFCLSCFILCPNLPRVEIFNCCWRMHIEIVGWVFLFSAELLYVPSGKI